MNLYRLPDYQIPYPAIEFQNDRLLEELRYFLYLRKNWIPIRLDNGYFGLPSFEFLSVAAYKPLDTEFGIRYSRPVMMALANLLSHRVIAPDTMSTMIEDRAIKRSNKDLGRVLALARFSGDAEIGEWPEQWLEALTVCFPTRWRDLALTAADAMRVVHHQCVLLFVVTDDLRRAVVNHKVLPAPVEPLFVKGCRLDQVWEGSVDQYRIFALAVDGYRDGVLGAHHLAHAAKHALVRVYVHRQLFRQSPVTISPSTWMTASLGQTNGPIWQPTQRSRSHVIT